GRGAVEQHPVTLLGLHRLTFGRRSAGLGHTGAVDVEDVHVEQSSITLTVEHQIQRLGTTRIGDLHGADLGVGVPTTRVRYLHRVHHGTVQRARTGLDRAARATGGHAVGDAVDPHQVDRVELDPVTVVDVADPLATAGTGGRDDLDAFQFGEELSLLDLRLEDVLVRTGQRGHALGPTVVGVTRVDDTEDVGVESVALVGRGLDDPLTTGRPRQRVAVVVVAEDVLHRDLGAVDLPVLRVGHRDRERHEVTETEEPTVDRRLQLHRRLGVAHGDHHARAAGQPTGVGHRQFRVVLAV